MHRHIATPENISICGEGLQLLLDWSLGRGRLLCPSPRLDRSRGFRSRHSDLSPDPEAFITRPSTNLLGGTEIDHVLHNSPTMDSLNTTPAPAAFGLGCRIIGRCWPPMVV